MPERVDDAAAFFNYCAIARDLGRARVHGRPCRRHVSGPRRFSTATRTGPRTSTASRRSASGRCAIPCCGSGSRRRGLDAAPTGAGPTSGWPRCSELGLRPIVACCTTAAAPPIRTCSTRRSPNGSPPTPGAWPSAIPGSTDYTPVNEPLTTARFSGALRPLVPARPRRRDVPARRCSTRCRATVLAMRAIREVDPARPAGPDRGPRPDLSTARLAYQAEFENERRWLSFDLLSGGSAASIRCGATCGRRGRHERARRCVPPTTPARPTSSASTTT